MLYTPAHDAAEKVVLHIHGTWGNFYGNPFIDVFGDFYAARGYAFLTGNNRGHDGGSITERFADSVLDLEAWTKFASGRGFRRLILQGHSLGALKALFYLQQPGAPQDSAQALILLSPFDVVAFYSSGTAQKGEEILKRVRKLAQVDPDSLVPKDIFDMWLISAGSFLDLADHGTAADIFPFRRGTLSGSPITTVRIPTFVGIGGEDFAAHPSPEEEVQQLRGLSNVRAVLVPGAPHNFAGREAALTKEVAAWMGELSL
jgi:alpha-beta hydrolase superfamily lysophospholipase